MNAQAQSRPDEDRIRIAVYEDLDLILGMWGEMMVEHERNDRRIRLADTALPSYRAYLGYHIHNSASRVFVAEVGGELAGFCLLTISRNLPMFLPERYGYLSDLFVRPRARRRGLGRRMVENAMKWLGENNVHSVQLQYYQFNEGGGAFWRSMGFAPFYARMWLDRT
jgi:GNAT superfamily N-acetyltransferase